MALNACAELPTVHALITGRSNAVELSSWFDRRSYYTKNPSFSYLYATVLVVLVCSRALVCYKPALVMLMLYAAAVHWLEVLFFVVVLRAKQDWGFDEAKGTDPGKRVHVLMGFIVFNAVLLTIRFFSLQRSLQQEKGENEKLRQKQLAEIRRMRAEYKQRRLQEKDK